MGQTLTNGVYLPDNGERNCYTGLSQNWQKLDNLLGNQGSNVSFSQTLTEGVEIGKITINGTEISMYHTDYSGKADASNVYTKTEIDTSLSSKANASELTTHTSNADIHVTSTDKSNWNAKQGALSTAQLNACNSGITSTKVSSYDTHVANTDVHVTTSDKSTWNAKQNALSTTQLSACNSGITSDKVATYDGYATSKANASDVVHKSGDETIGGQKILSNTLKLYHDMSNISSINSLNTKVYNLDINSETGLPNNGYTFSWNTTCSNPIFYTGIYTSLLKSGEINTSLRAYKYKDSSKRSDITIGYINSDVDYASYAKFNCGQVYPTSNATTDLGTSTNKWKTINGVSPSSLGMPNWNADSTGYTDIIGNLTFDGVTRNVLICTKGWVVIVATCTNMFAYRNDVFFGATRVNDTKMALCIPVDFPNLNLFVNIQGTSIDIARIYHCQGNV